MAMKRRWVPVSILDLMDCRVKTRSKTVKELRG